MMSSTTSMEEKLAECFDASVYSLKFSDSFQSCEVKLLTSSLFNATMRFEGINKLSYRKTNPHARLDGPNGVDGYQAEYVWVDYALLYPGLTTCRKLEGSDIWELVFETNLFELTIECLNANIVIGSKHEEVLDAS